MHLLRAAVARRVPLRIALIDRLGRHGLGQAYATTNPDHLLNAPAGRMSALAGDPDHLVRWAAGHGFPAPGFLPRPVYGRYLRDLLGDAQLRAAPQSRLTEMTADVVAIRPGTGGRPVRLVLGDGSCLEADVAILASGNPPPVAPIPVPASPRFVADPWAPGALDAVADGSPVVIMGTGLSMLDVAMSVTSHGGRPPAKVTAVSRHALLPRVHRGMPAPGGDSVWLPALAGPPGPVRLGDLIWQVRAAMTSRPEQWQDVIDALRPEVPSLWQRLSPADQRVFLRHVARYWEVHRHRMPPATAQRITALRIAGRLRVLPARVTGVTEDAGQLRVSVAAGGAVSQLAAGWLINATGPGTDITATPRPAAPRPAQPRAGPAGPAPAGHRRQPGRRRAGQRGHAQRDPVHARPDAARAALRDDRDPGDPRPGGRPGRAADHGARRPVPPGQRRLTPAGQVGMG